MFENKKKFALWMYPDTLEKVGKSTGKTIAKANLNL